MLEALEADLNEEDDMRIVAADGVTGTALADGRMKVRTAGRGEFRCSPVGSAMWVALRVNDGFLELAASSLADAWQTDERKVRTAMTAWADRLMAAGLLKAAA
ncbi:MULTISPECIES: PqqD family protein [unclassified Streptomyces]|uniref:PqqD family protein n=2 Tax=Streptomyces TaxID=1883 RepID=UPI002E2C2232|nr:MULTISPECIES: PqqD family protein [unclassified Streptomyces]